MAKILIQTTTSDKSEDWNAASFDELAGVLREAKHEVVARDREPAADGSDPVLSTLAESDFDELWLMAVDRGNGLAPADVRGILRFRDRGGGVLTSRDHLDRGASLLNLGSLGAVNHFHTYNRERQSRRTSVAEVEPQAPPHTNGSTNGGYLRIEVLHPVHEVLRSAESDSGMIDYLPSPPHEGSISVPPDFPYARVIAVSTSHATGKAFNVAIAVENEPGADGKPCGRAIATPTLYHFVHMEREAYKSYVKNIARWLDPARS